MLYVLNLIYTGVGFIYIRFYILSLITVVRFMTFIRLLIVYGT